MTIGVEMTNMNEMKFKALIALEKQYNFINLLVDCGDAERAPQYFEQQMHVVQGLIEMYEAVFEDYAPYNRTEAHAMIIKLSSEICPF